MSLLALGGGASGASTAKLDASDVFSAYLYTGNGSTQTITNGIDLAGKGGMVWLKGRNTAYDHMLMNVEQGDLFLRSNTSDTISDAGNIISYLNSGFKLEDSNVTRNGTGNTYISWTFRKAPKFFTQEVKVHTNGTASTVDLSSLGEVGMVTVKATNATSNWFTWHRGLTAGNNLKLNLTDAQSTTSAYLSVSGTTLTIASTAPSATYIVYAWAHDTSADGIIQCGSFTTDGSGNATINLGWEPQYVMYKNTNGTAYNWNVTDSMRGSKSGYTSAFLGAKLSPNLSDAENQNTMASIFTSTGFAQVNMYTNTTYIYMAIRRPNKVPTSGTEVYNVLKNYGSTLNFGFVTDMHLGRRYGTALDWFSTSRLTNRTLKTNLTDVEFDASSSIKFYNNFGVLQTLYASDNIEYAFKRAKGFFDIVCYTGDGSAGRDVPHSLGVTPELLITKSRNGTGNWMVSWGTTLATSIGLFLNSTSAKLGTSIGIATMFSTATTFYAGTATESANTSGISYVTYLFSSLAGVSKVGFYTGNGTSQTINCGFSTGARFILIKRTDATGDWYVWDTARGIVAANDPHLSLNTTAAEVTTDDSIDPESTGFIVNQNATTNINVNGASYIYLSIA